MSVSSVYLLLIYLFNDKQIIHMFEINQFIVLVNKLTKNKMS